MPGLLNATPTKGQPASRRLEQQGPVTEGIEPGINDVVNANSAMSEEAGINVSPEEQAQYNEFVTNAMTLMNNKKGLQKLLKAIGGEGDPVTGLANVVASIVMRVEDSAEKNGTKIGGDVLLHGGAEILEQVADLAGEAGVHTYTEDELESATYKSMDIYREARQGQGKLDQAAFGQDMSELQAAEADGSLEKQMPGITEHSQKQSRKPLEGEHIPADKSQQRGLLG